MTQLNDKDHAAQMADMKSFDEEMPSIGIFWYDPHWDLGHGWSGDMPGTR